MLTKIGEIVHQIAFIALLAAFLEMLLPEKRITRYVRLVLGLFVVVAIITPIAEGLRYGKDMDVTSWDLRIQQQVADPLYRGKALAEENMEEALKLYSERLAGQIKALVILLPEIETAEVVVDVASAAGQMGAIKSVAVVAYLAKQTKQEVPSTDMVPEQEIHFDRTSLTAGDEEKVREKTNGERPELTGILNNGKSLIEPGRDIEPQKYKEPTKDEIERIRSRIVEMISHFYGIQPGVVQVKVLAAQADNNQSGGVLRGG